MRVRHRPPPCDPDWAYFLDFDGTLVSLAAAPGQVHVDPALRRILRELDRATGGAVALITGRAISDIDALLVGRRFPVAGQHGLERRTHAGRLLHRPLLERHLDPVRSRLARTVSRHPQLQLEDKGASLALHYRRAPTLASFAHRLARAEAATLGHGYAVRTGKRVIEIVPSGTDKGMALAAFMHEPPFRGRTPVFVGDDLTDELGFRMVDLLGGHSVKVGPGRSAARWRLPDVAAVRAWLQDRTEGP